MTLRIEKYSLDLLRAVPNRKYAVDMGCGDVGLGDCEYMEFVITG